MSPKGIVSPVILIGFVLLVISFFGGYYLGQNSGSSLIKIPIVEKNSVNQAPQLIPSLAPEDRDSSESYQFDIDQQILKNITSTKDLPDIAQAVIKHDIGNGDNKIVPRIDFTSNDGEYATVSDHQVGVAGGGVVFLVKRGSWVVVYQGNGYGECKDILPIRQKYNIRKDFLLCGGELN